MTPITSQPNPAAFAIDFLKNLVADPEAPIAQRRLAAVAILQQTNPKSLHAPPKPQSPAGSKPSTVPTYLTPVHPEANPSGLLNCPARLSPLSGLCNGAGALLDATTLTQLSSPRTESRADRRRQRRRNHQLAAGIHSGTAHSCCHDL